MAATAIVLIYDAAIPLFDSCPPPNTMLRWSDHLPYLRHDAGFLSVGPESESAHHLPDENAKSEPLNAAVNFSSRAAVLEVRSSRPSSRIQLGRRGASHISSASAISNQYRYNVAVSSLEGRCETVAATNGAGGKEQAMATVKTAWALPSTRMSTSAPLLMDVRPI